MRSALASIVCAVTLCAAAVAGTPPKPRDTAAKARNTAAKFHKEYQAGVDAYRLGKFDEARAHLEKSKKLDPKLPGPARFLAAVARAQQKWDECIAESHEALRLNPQSTEVDETRKLYNTCRSSAGRMPYRGPDLGDAAAIAVQTGVAGATVKINKLAYGGTPLAPRRIAAGSLDVEITKQGYKPVHVTIVALAGIVNDVVVDLEATPEPGASHPRR